MIGLHRLMAACFLAGAVAGALSTSIAWAFASPSPQHVTSRRLELATDSGEKVSVDVLCEGLPR